MLHALGGRLSSPILLEVKNYPGVRSVLGTGKFVIKKSTATFVEGPSGSGKTRLFRRITDLDPEPMGDIHFEGQNVQTYPLPHLRRQILFIPQEPPRFQGTTMEVLNTLLSDREGRIEEAQKKKLLERLDLMDTLKQPTSQLSGGEWKRLILVAALCKNPKILLLDEPFAGLDETRIKDAASAIQNRITLGLTTLWTSHQKTIGPLRPDQTIHIFKT